MGVTNFAFAACHWLLRRQTGRAGQLSVTITFPSLLPSGAAAALTSRIPEKAREKERTEKKKKKKRETG